MLRMDGFEVRRARSVEEALELRAEEPESAWLAGGTDLLPNLKHRLLRPRRVVDVSRALPRGWREEEGRLVVGAGTRIAELARLAEVPALARAAGLVAGPQLRRMGTLGGNVMLDTRCVYYNRPAGWRRALGGCLKAEGSWCHVVGSPRTCVATRSGDTVPVLVALRARARLVGPSGARTVPVAELFRFDGRHHLAVEPGELLTEVELPRPPEGTRATYEKLRLRAAIDFPLLGVAAVLRLEDDRIADLRVVLGAVGPAPREVPGLGELVGQPLTDEAIDEVAERAFRRARPLASVSGDPAWRRQMVRVLVRRALRTLRDGPAAG